MKNLRHMPKNLKTDLEMRPSPPRWSSFWDNYDKTPRGNLLIDIQGKKKRREDSRQADAENYYHLPKTTSNDIGLFSNVVRGKRGGYTTKEVHHGNLLIDFGGKRLKIGRI